MVEETTKGIKISVKTKYNGIIHEDKPQYFFSYFISIENTSLESVQLLERFWYIYDSLNGKKFVEGEGVVGQIPTLEPNDIYTYRSNCLLSCSIGAMKGEYKMINKETNTIFFVTIPSFQLNSSFVLN